MTTWILNDLPPDGEYTSVAKLLVYCVFVLLSMDVFKICIAWHTNYISRKERDEGKKDRVRIINDMVTILQLVRELLNVDKTHRTRMMNAAQQVTDSIPAVEKKMEDKTFEIKQAVGCVPEKVMEKIKEAGPDSGMTLKVPDALK